MNSTLETKIRSSLVNGRLPCEMAFAIARELRVTPKEIGETAEALNIKISDCQLGVFPKPKGQRHAAH